MAKTASEHLNFPYTITYNSEDIGFTTPDGVTLTIERNDVNKLFDQYGASVVGVLSGGENVRLAMSMAQFNMRNFKVAVPWAVKYLDGSDGRVTFGRVPGQDETNRTAELLLHRFTDAAGNTSRDIRFFIAIVTEIGDITLNSATGFGIPLTFTALIDTSKSDGGLLAEIGTTDASTAVSS